jgi:DNA repair protein RecO (recombination protein O)
LNRDRTTVKGEAVVLSSRRINDADRMVVLFTRMHGKIRAVIRSVRRSRNRYRGNAEIGSVVRTSVFFRTRDLESGRVTELEPVHSLAGLRQDMARIMVLSYALNLSDEVCAFHDRNTPFFDLLEQFLLHLDCSGNMGQTVLLLRYFEVKLLALHGLHPELRRCASCGRTGRVKLYFSLNTLSVICTACLPDSFGTGVLSRDLVELSKDLVAFYEDCLRLDMHAMSCRPLSAVEEKKARLFFRKLIRSFLGKDLMVLKVARDFQQWS